MERVFLNLFLNAIQAVSEKGRIVIRTAFLPAEHEVEIQVSDDGPGIPEEHRQRVFEPFFTTKEGGTGLGLCICQFIVQQHRGRITLDESHPKGATFLVKLPAIPNREFWKSSIEPTARVDAIDGTEVANTSQ